MNWNRPWRKKTDLYLVKSSYFSTDCSPIRCIIVECKIWGPDRIKIRICTKGSNQFYADSPPPIPGLQSSLIGSDLRRIPLSSYTRASTILEMALSSGILMNKRSTCRFNNVAEPEPEPPCFKLTVLEPIFFYFLSCKCFNLFIVVIYRFYRTQFQLHSNSSKEQYVMRINILTFSE